MKLRTTVSLLATVLLALQSGFVTAQTDSKAQDDSIKKMQARVAQIEAEMQKVDLSQARSLGDEAFGLYGKIDQTFLQLKSAYQQQVIQLNQRMQRKWQQIEDADEDDREKIAKQLSQLEKDWDRTFDRLTNVHDDHLQQLKNSLSKVRGEFSEVAGKAQAELEASNFEARARWEKGHDIFLAINRTYVRIVGDQLKWLEKEKADNPKDAELAAKLTKVRIRHAALQDRLQRRLSAHIGHLQDELKTRMSQLNVTTNWDLKRSIFASIDDLYQRTDETFELVQGSYRDSIAVFKLELEDATTNRDDRTRLGDTKKKKVASLKSSYLSRVGFIDSECEELEDRIAGTSNAEEKSSWTAKVTDLRLLVRDLRNKANALEPAMIAKAVLR